MTPTQLIAAVREWSGHVITQPDDPMRAKVDAVLAMADVYAANTHWHTVARADPYSPSDDQSALVSHQRACGTAKTALLAAGVEVAG